MVLAGEVGGRWSAETQQFVGSVGPRQGAVSAKVLPGEGSKSMVDAERDPRTHGGEGFCRVTFGEAPIAGGEC